MPFCAVRWCGSDSRKNNYKKDNITFHRFPSDVNTKEIWMSKTRRGDDWYPTSNSTICSRHFTPDCFIGMKCRRKLFQKSIPTLYLPMMVNSPQTTNDKDCIVNNKYCTETTQPSSSQATVRNNDNYHFLRKIVHLILNCFFKSCKLNLTHFRFCDFIESWLFYKEEGSEELVACRVCLSVDGRLRNISGSGLEHALAALTGVAFSADDGFPRHLCACCRARLSQCAAFRDSCRRSAALLRTLAERGPLTMKTIKAFSQECQIHNLTSNEVFQFGTDSFIVLAPLVKTEVDDLHEEIDNTDVEFLDYKDIKNDANQLNENFELPTVIQDVPKYVELRMSPTCTTAEMETDRSNLQSGVDEYIESPVENDTRDLPDAAKEITTVNSRKRKSVTFQGNTVKKEKKKSKMHLVSTDVVTDTSKEPSRLRKDIGKKSPTKAVTKKSSNKQILRKEQKHEGEETSSGTPTFSCELCGKRYKLESFLFMHKRSHDPTKKSEETVAALRKESDSAFEEEYNFEIRVLSKEEQKQKIKDRIKHNKSTYSCVLCGKNHATEKTFVAHNTIYHNPSFPFECDVCHHRFRSFRYLCTHRLDDSHRGHRAEFACKQCGDVCQNRWLAKLHYFTHKGKMYKCRYCEEEYGRSASLYTHIMKQHPGEREACTECGETFQAGRGLGLHKRVVHKANGKPNVGSRCQDCGVMFLNAEALQRHCELSSGRAHAALWACAACGDSCGSEAALQAHAHHKHPPDQHYCKECDKTFANASSFELHAERKHRNRRREGCLKAKRPTVCEICGKVFTNARGIEYHVNRHLGLQPYQCPHCPKAFFSKPRYKIHLRVHAGQREKPFQCEQCPLVLSSKGNYKRHLKTVHLKMQKKCHICGKQMSVASIWQHVRSVHLQHRYVRKRDSTKKRAQPASEVEKQSKSSK